MKMKINMKMNMKFNSKTQMQLQIILKRQVGVDKPMYFFADTYTVCRNTCCTREHQVNNNL